jgi:DNA-binding transcriptional ArsR family regulator
VSDHEPAFQPRELDDPRVMRALAHPVRLALIEQLTFRGPMTATQCAPLVGQSPSSCSFHLRMLAKYGFVEEAEGGTGRQRPWRVVTIGNRWTTAPDTPVALRTAGEALAGIVRDRDRALLEQYLARAAEFEPEWSEAAVHSNFGGYLTPDELREIGDRLLEMWAPYLARLQEGADRPEGSRLVHMFAHGFPRADSLDDPATDGQDDA